MKMRLLESHCKIPPKSGRVKPADKVNLTKPVARAQKPLNDPLLMFYGRRQDVVQDHGHQRPAGIGHERCAFQLGHDAKAATAWTTPPDEGLPVVFLAQERLLVKTLIEPTTGHNPSLTLNVTGQRKTPRSTDGYQVI